MLAVCEADDRIGGDLCASLLTTEEMGLMTGRRPPFDANCLLDSDVLALVGWDCSVLAVAGPTAMRQARIRNFIFLFALCTMHWTGLYDIDQLLYDATEFLHAPGSLREKLVLIRGVQAQVAMLQHESKASYLAEHARDLGMIRQLFESWETENLLTHLDKKREMLGALVTRLYDERLSGLLMFLTFLSVAGVLAGIGQLLHTPKIGLGVGDVTWTLTTVAAPLVWWLAYVLHRSR